MNPQESAPKPQVAPGPPVMTLGSMFPDATTAEDEWADYGDHAAHLRVLRQNLAKL